MANRSMLLIGNSKQFDYNKIIMKVKILLLLPITLFLCFGLVYFLMKILSIENSKCQTGHLKIGLY